MKPSCARILTFILQFLNDVSCLIKIKNLFANYPENHFLNFFFSHFFLSVALYFKYGQTLHWWIICILQFWWGNCWYKLIICQLNPLFCQHVSPYRTCSASTPLEEGDTGERRTRTGDPRPSAGAWMRLSPREAASLNTEWHKRECERKWEREREREGELTDEPEEEKKERGGEITGSQAEWEMEKKDRVGLFVRDGKIL